MYFTFKRSNKQTKKPINRFLQDGASAGIRSLQTSIDLFVYDQNFYGVVDGEGGGSSERCLKWGWE